LALIDSEKSYDSVPRNKLWEVLKRCNVYPKLVEVIREIYESNIAFVLHGNSVSQPIATTKGLRQGCSLSPLLFNIYTERALEEWKRSCQGMGVAVKNRYIFTLNFAGDQVVIAQDHFDLEFMVRRLRKT
jgi:hypothetical protein